MDFSFTLEQEMIQKSALKIFEKHYDIEKIRKYIDSPSIKSDFVTAISESGFLGIIADENVGGLDLGVVDALPIIMESGKNLVPFPLIEGIIASKILSKPLPDITEKIISGEQIATIAWLDSQEHYLNQSKMELSGTCKAVPFADIADWVLIPFKIGNKETKLVCVDLSNENINVRKMESLDLTYPIYSLNFNNYPITSEQILEINEGGNQNYHLMRNLGAIFLSAEMVGAAEKTLYTSVEYTKERVQFGRQIGEFQSLKHIAADCYVKLENMRSATEYAAWAIDNEIDDYSISIAKEYSSEESLKIVQNSIQLLGGIGFTWENDTHLYLKRVLRASQSLGGSYEHREEMARRIIDNEQ